MFVCVLTALEQSLLKTESKNPRSQMQSKTQFKGGIKWKILSFSNPALEVFGFFFGLRQSKRQYLVVPGILVLRIVTVFPNCKMVARVMARL